MPDQPKSIILMSIWGMISDNTEPINYDMRDISKNYGKYHIKGKQQKLKTKDLNIYRN